MRLIPNEELDVWIGRYEADRARAQEKVDWIEKRGHRFQEACGNEPWHDVTDELLRDWKTQVALFDSSVEHYRKLKD
jgi:hypothetical protein